MRQVSPSQRKRLDQWFEGPQNGEDENAWLRRMNSFITDDDRQWIVEFMSYYNTKGERP